MPSVPTWNDKIKKHVVKGGDFKESIAKAKAEWDELNNSGKSMNAGAKKRKSIKRSKSGSKKRKSIKRSRMNRSRMNRSRMNRSKRGGGIGWMGGLTVTAVT